MNLPVASGARRLLPRRADLLIRQSLFEDFARPPMFL
jgi:hypothetical protein